MNHQQSLSLSLKELWQESPRWQNLVLAAVICTVMAIVFHPAGSGGQGGNSYTPPSQTSQSSANGPFVPPKAGSGAPVPPPPSAIDQAGTANSNQAPALPPPGSGRPLSVVAPIAPAPIKIKPSKSADNVEIEALPQIKNGEDFGKTDKTWFIKPRAPVTEE